MIRGLIVTLCLASFARSGMAQGGVSAGAQTLFLIPREPRDTFPNRPADIRIVVRDVLRPAVNLRSYDIQLDGPPLLLRALPDTTGVVRFASLAPGQYKIRARAGGYLSLELMVEAGPGCPTWVEVYLSARPCEIGYCPPAGPSRAAVTACEPLPPRPSTPDR